MHHESHISLDDKWLRWRNCNSRTSLASFLSLSGNHLWSILMNASVSLFLKYNKPTSRENTSKADWLNKSTHSDQKTCSNTPSAFAWRWQHHSAVIESLMAWRFHFGDLQSTFFPASSFHRLFSAARFLTGNVVECALIKPKLGEEGEKKTRLMDQAFRMKCRTVWENLFAFRSLV